MGMVTGSSGSTTEGRGIGKVGWTSSRVVEGCRGRWGSSTVGTYQERRGVLLLGMPFDVWIRSPGDAKPQPRCASSTSLSFRTLPGPSLQFTRPSSSILPSDGPNALARPSLHRAMLHLSTTLSTASTIACTAYSGIGGIQRRWANLGRGSSPRRREMRWRAVLRELIRKDRPGTKPKMGESEEVQEPDGKGNWRLLMAVWIRMRARGDRFNFEGAQIEVRGGTERWRFLGVENMNQGIVGFS
ncbi:hypothetical protein FA13DRAFT_1706111 [Coprinellus micaceus]|uniref:Uncharacterized protein n=1 Tax=Coprinellus micaceus TaxID=71717 RepID=A0A4Y7TTP3_COPMI|nr:hypothetical protein FA13DRAFT_1706111 [Coprinellus micaceus]